jgi:hypothetical protein
MANFESRGASWVGLRHPVRNKASGEGLASLVVVALMATTACPATDPAATSSARSGSEASGVAPAQKSDGAEQGKAPSVASEATSGSRADDTGALPTADAVDPDSKNTPPPAGDDAPTAGDGTTKQAFEALVDQLIAKAPTSEATALVAASDEASATKAAWGHYKAKRPAMAAPWFARAAALGPSSWKPAHNLACSLALTEQWGDAAVAVRESIRRGGDKARARAKSDADLAGLRARSGWDELVATPGAADGPTDGAEEGGATTSQGGAVEADPEFADDGASEDDVPAAGDSTLSKAQLEAWGCPPDAVDFQHVCTIDIDGAFVWSPLVFDTKLDVSIAWPRKPRGAEWVALARNAFTAKLKKQIDYVAPTDDPVFSGPIDTVVGYISDNPLEHDDDENPPPPLVWWGGTDVPVLVLNHPQDERGLAVFTLTLVIKEGDTWKAKTLEVVNPKLVGEGLTGTLFSGHFMRKDGLELFTWSTNYDRKRGEAEDHHYDSWLCRIRWREGTLQRACVDTWTNREDAP